MQTRSCLPRASTWAIPRCDIGERLWTWSWQSSQNRVRLSPCISSQRIEHGVLTRGGVFTTALASNEMSGEHWGKPGNKHGKVFTPPGANDASPDDRAENDGGLESAAP